MIPRQQANLFGLRFLFGPLAEQWLNKLAGCSVVCLRGQARRRSAIIIVSSPPPQTMPPLPPLPMTTLTAIGGKGFTSCSWVNLQPESALRHCRIIGSAGATTTKVMLAPTMARNNIEDGDSKSRRWTARRATGAGRGGGGNSDDDVSGNDAVGGGQKMQCKQTVNDTTIGGDGQQQQATTGDCSCDGG
jgi:hypothetical protein